MLGKGRLSEFANCATSVSQRFSMSTGSANTVASLYASTVTGYEVSALSAIECRVVETYVVVVDRRENGLFHKCHIKYRVENGKDEILKVAQTFPKTGETSIGLRLLSLGCRNNQLLCV